MTLQHLASYRHQVYHHTLSGRSRDHSYLALSIVLRMGTWPAVGISGGRFSFLSPPFVWRLRMVSADDDSMAFFFFLTRLQLGSTMMAAAVLYPFLLPLVSAAIVQPIVHDSVGLHPSNDGTRHQTQMPPYHRIITESQIRSETSRVCRRSSALSLDNRRESICSYGKPSSSAHSAQSRCIINCTAEGCKQCFHPPGDT